MAEAPARITVYASGATARIEPRPAPGPTTYDRSDLVANLARRCQDAEDWAEVDAALADYHKAVEE